MNYKKLSVCLLFFLLAFSIFSGINFSAASGLSGLKINLICDASDYEIYGFKDLGIYYTPMALCEFHMPFAVPKKDSGSITKNDLSGNLLDTPSNLTSRKPTLKYTILAENEDYYIIDYQMNIKASTSKFSVDFVPSIKTKSFSEFAWWNSEWGYRKQITINHNYIDTALTNFPVLINASADSSLSGKVNANLSDIRFTTADETTRFNHEINDYTIGASDVSFNIWVNVTGLSDTVDTVIYMYFNNNSASPLSTADINATWDINYTGVYHLEGNNGKLCKDSTANQNSMNYSGDVPTTRPFGVGYGQYFDNDNDNITIPTDIYTNGVEPFTFECIYKSDNITPFHQEIMEFTKDGTDVVFLRLDRYGKYSFGSYTNNVEMWLDDDTDSYDTNTHYLGYSWGTADMVLIEDSSIIHTDTSYTFIDYTDPYTRGATIGNSWDSTRDFNGTMDEIRFSNIRRSNAWINASYDTYYQSDFAVFGVLERYATTTMSNPDPSNESVDISPYAQNVSITITEPDGNTMDVYFRSNSSGGWVDFGTNKTVNNGTYYQPNTNFSGFSTKYWWCVNLTNGTVWENNTYSFTTRAEYIHTVPTGINAILEDLDSLNITWTKGTNAYNTLVVMKATSYPSSRTDGTVMYNGTLSTYTDNSFNSTRYYALYSWNNTDDLYSSGVNVEWGSLTINVFDESNGTAINNWNVFISNQDGTDVYENASNSNPLIIDVDDIPHGKDVTIRINADNYRNQTYIMTLDTNAQYVLNAHLPLKSSSELYLLQVKNEIDLVVPDAYITIRRYINETVGFGNISSLITDGEGQVNIYFIPNTLYKITIEATGYNTGYSDYYPSDSIFTHTLRIYFRSGTGEPKKYLFDNITWSITPTNPYHTNSIDVAYTINSDDGKLEWFNATVHVWNSTNEIWVLLYAENITDQPTGGTIDYTIANNTGKYSFTCRFKKEGFPVYTFGTEESCRIYYIYLPDRGWGIENIPSFVYMLFTIILMIGATGLLALVGAGDASGIGGMGVMAIMFAYNPSLLIGGISCWFVLFAAVVVYGTFLFVMKE